MKSSMIRKWCISVGIAILFLVGCFVGYQVNKEKEGIISLDELVTALKKGRLDPYLLISEEKHKSDQWLYSADWVLNGTKPDHLSIGGAASFGPRDEITIYVYDSKWARRKGVRELKKHSYTSSEFAIYEKKNVIVLHWPHPTRTEKDYYSSYIKTALSTFDHD